MPKQPTEKQIAARKAFGEAARIRAAAKKEKKVEQPTFIGVPDQTIGMSEIDELRQQIAEIKNSQFTELVKALKEGRDGTGTAIADGKLTGTFEKYVISADRYPSPVDRLNEEPKLARFAFPLNYELNYEVGVSEYTTIDNIRTREPKFMLELIRIIMDEETGEPTNGRYIICRFLMHEDPEAAMVIAREQGLDVEEDTEEAFLNEMRFIRMRDWVLECFYPAPVKQVSNKKDMVIGGRLVTYFEVNAEESTAIDFTKLPKIKF